MNARCAVTILSLLLTPMSLLMAHGGAYYGPSPTLPPGIPGAPGTGPGTGGPSVGPVTGGGLLGAAKKRAPSYTNWETWWRLNKHPYLNLRARLASKFSVTGGERSTMATVEAGAISPRPSFGELETEVIPLLKKLLKENDPDIVDSAVLALARVTPAEKASVVLEDIKRALGHDERSVRQSAILALGVLGSKDAIPLLVEIANDTAAGRRSTRSTQEVDEVQRAMAAVALGLLSGPETIEVVRKIADKTDDAKVDLKAGAILALGLYEDGQLEIVPFLLDILGDKRMAETIRAQIPVAVARLGDAARPMLPVILKMAQGKRTRDMLRQSCVVAMGKLAAPEDEEVVETLRSLAERSSDQSTRHFALIALAEVGARAGRDHARHEKLLREIERDLLGELRHPKNKDQLPWAALACALFARGYPKDLEARQVIEKKLFEAFDDTNNPSYRSAVTIALGLCEANVYGKPLLKEMMDSSDRSVKGHFAEALGLMQYEPARQPLKSMLEDESDPEYRVQLATGLGLMGDLEVSDLLVEEMVKAKTLWVVSSVAKALGNVGDRSALPSLVKLADNDAKPGLARAFACVALGLIGEKTMLPWNSRISAGANYMAAFYTQTEIMDIL